jgi:hypothetical protein
LTDYSHSPCVQGLWVQFRTATFGAIPMQRVKHPTKKGPGRIHGQGVPHPGKAMRAARKADRIGAELARRANFGPGNI